MTLVNQYLTLNVPLQNGHGTSLDVSTMKADKNIILVGEHSSVVSLEGSNDGSNFVPFLNFDGETSDDRNVSFIFKWIRVAVTQWVSGQPSITIGAEDTDINEFNVLNIPVSDGPGTATDLGSVASPKTFIFSGTYLRGEQCFLETSQNNTDWQSVVGITYPQVVVVSGIIHYFRVNRRFSNGGTPIVQYGVTQLLVPVITSTSVETIYVRSTGSDTTGDGSLANPFLTTPYVLNNIVPLSIPHNKVYKIEHTDYFEDMPDGWIMPSFVSPDAFSFNFVPDFLPFVFQAPIVFESVPTTIATLTIANITGPDTVDADTGLHTLNTNLNLTLDQYRGMILVSTGTLFNQAQIASNTAGPNSTIQLVAITALTLPYAVVQPSGGFNNASAVSTNTTFNLGEQNASVAFNGIAFTHANPSNLVFALDLAGAKNVELVLCEIEGFVTNGVQNAQLQYSRLKPAKPIRISSSPIAFIGVFIDIPSSFINSQSGGKGGLQSWNTVIAFTSWDVGCTGAATTLSVINWNNVLVSGGGGIIVRGGAGTHVLEKVQVNAASHRGVWVDRKTQVSLIRVTGTLNIGGGVYCSEGGYALADTLTTISGDVPGVNEVVVDGTDATWAAVRGMASGILSGLALSIVKSP